MDGTQLLVGLGLLGAGYMIGMFHTLRVTTERAKFHIRNLHIRHAQQEMVLINTAYHLMRHQLTRDQFSEQMTTAARREYGVGLTLVANPDVKEETIRDDNDKAGGTGQG